MDVDLFSTRRRQAQAYGDMAARASPMFKLGVAIAGLGISLRLAARFSLMPKDSLTRSWRAKTNPIVGLSGPFVL